MLKNALRLNNRLALVTGGTSGIGFAVADRLAQDGARVLICSRKQENVDAALTQLSNKGYDVTGVACHISNRDQRRTVVEELEKLGELTMPRNALPLENRIALVTGGTSGIGLAVANRLAHDGAKVLISSRKQENVDAAVKQLKNKGYDVTGFACHISNRDERRNLVKELEKLGGLDILVQCAGVNPYIGPILDCPEDAWDKIFDVNLKSNFLLTKEVMHLLKQSKCGRIVYNSSMTAYFSSNTLGSYGVSKTALVAFTKTAALHLGKYNITVNCVAPGLVDTPFGSVLFEDQNVMDLINRYQAINRICKPEEVAGVVSFLASEDSSYVTGETICVSGGLPCKL